MSEFENLVIQHLEWPGIWYKAFQEEVSRADKGNTFEQFTWLYATI